MTIPTHTDMLIACEALTRIIHESQDHPLGPEVDEDSRTAAGAACVQLCDSTAQARTLWKLVVDDCGGYMPQAAARALIRAATTDNLVPDVEAPDPS